MAIEIKDFVEKGRYVEPDKVWTKFLQFKDGYIYATNYHILARKKGEEPEQNGAIKRIQHYEKFFETTECFGTIERKAINKLAVVGEDELDNKLKIKNMFFQKKYLKKIFTAGGKEAKVYGSKIASLYIFIFEEMEFALMEVINEVCEQVAPEVPMIPEPLKIDNMITDLNDINRETPEGRLLFAALVKITTESQTDKTPYQVIAQLNVLATEMDKHK